MQIFWGAGVAAAGVVDYSSSGLVFPDSFTFVLLVCYFMMPSVVRGFSIISCNCCLYCANKEWFGLPLRLHHLFKKTVLPMLFKFSSPQCLFFMFSDITTIQIAFDNTYNLRLEIIFTFWFHVFLLSGGNFQGRRKLSLFLSSQKHLFYNWLPRRALFFSVMIFNWLSLIFSQ